VSVVPSKVQSAPAGAQPHVPAVPEPTQVIPWQHPVGVALGLQAPPPVLQLSHEQLVDPAVQVAPLGSMQLSPGGVEQHASVGTHDAYWDLQVGGTLQTPSMHCSVVTQHGLVASQAVPLGAHVLTDWQTPLVAVGGSLKQVRPLQHSSAVQVPPVSTHGGAQKPPAQLLEQQSLATEQPAPLAEQAETSHVKDVPLDLQMVPSQQEPSSAPVQAPCSAVQVGVVQRRTPSAPGVHGTPPQHWSRNWQTLAVPVPGSMQHGGSNVQL
jgi:hypothetical protein